MKQEYIQIKNLTKTIKGTTVLSNISINLDRGKIYGFKGKNGSGKTMLFRAICGLIKPTEGKVVINGKLLGEDMSFAENSGVLIEYPGFLNNYTGFQNLKFLADINGKIGKEEIMETLEKVGLVPSDRRKVKKYSLGMKQRLGIAQAIMENPDLIILDEPTNALDVDGVELLTNILFKLKKENKAILISNHDKEEMEKMCDEIYTLDKGKIINHEILKENEAV